MKKVLMSIFLFTNSLLGIAQVDGDSIRNLIIPPNNEAEIFQQSREIITRLQIINTIYLVAFLLAIVVGILIYRKSKKQQNQLLEITRKHVEEKVKFKTLAETFGYILNETRFPCCIVDKQGNLEWTNDAFNKFYGNELQNFDKFSGVTNQSKENIESNSTITFLVKSKNTKSKVYEYKRTIISIADIKFGIVENILTED